MTGDILTLGLGSFSDAHHLVTLGYGFASPPPPPTPTTSTLPVSAGSGAGGWAVRKRRQDIARILPIIIHLIRGD